MDKARLREEYKAKRLDMSPDEVSRKSRAILAKVVSGINWEAIKTVHIFSPIAGLNEVDTTPLAKELAKKYPEVKITPGSADKNHRPPLEKFDLIIVPVLAFDKTNHRLGWGGGWYDRFLAGQPQSLKVGLAYQDSLIEDGLPIEPHDIPLDKVITEI